MHNTRHSIPSTAETAEILNHANFERVRYAQVWEDADVLLKALDVQAGDNVLSIASAGDNALALLTTDAERVIALDLSAAQLHCLALRVAAFQVLSHAEVLELLGSRPEQHGQHEQRGQYGQRRLELYAHARTQLSLESRAFWDQRTAGIRAGIGSARVGKFERYFEIFRRFILPLMLSSGDVNALLTPKSRHERHAFYRQRVNTWRWQLPFRLFFSRAVMGRLGRDPAFFKYVQDDTASSIQKRSGHAFTELDPSQNPYLHWIFRGHHGDALPLYLRPEHFQTIRERLDRLEWRQQSIEDFVRQSGANSIDRFNLSDIFEYMSDAATQTLLEQLAHAGRPNGRLVYWNMMVPRQSGAALAEQLQHLPEESEQLHAQDTAFFYSRLVIERVLEDA